MMMMISLCHCSADQRWLFIATDRRSSTPALLCWPWFQLESRDQSLFFHWPLNAIMYWHWLESDRVPRWSLQLLAQSCSASLGPSCLWVGVHCVYFNIAFSFRVTSLDLWNYFKLGGVPINTRLTFDVCKAACSRLDTVFKLVAWQTLSSVLHMKVSRTESSSLVQVRGIMCEVTEINKMPKTAIMYGPGL